MEVFPLERVRLKTIRCQLYPRRRILESTSPLKMISKMRILTKCNSPCRLLEGLLSSKKMKMRQEQLRKMRKSTRRKMKTRTTRKKKRLFPSYNCKCSSKSSHR